MKIRAFLFLTSLLCIGLLPAQEWLKTLPYGEPNFYQIKAAFDAYYHNPQEECRKDGPYKHFMRWAEFTEPRVYPSGYMPDPSATMSEYQKFSTNKTNAGNWNFMGPVSIPGTNTYGRLNCVQFNPNNYKTLWVGAAGGGIWRSTNRGNTWEYRSTGLPVLSIADIAIGTSDTLTMYACTGDGYGYEVSGVFWGGTYSIGLVKSTDGGNTWNTTALNTTVSTKLTLRRVLVHPTNPNIVIVASNSGIRYSTDGGTSFSTKQGSESFYDLEFQPGNPSNVVASGTSGIYASSDGGNTWSFASGSPANGNRLSVEATADAPSYLYSLNTSGDVYLSTNFGMSWNFVSTTDATLYGYYDNVLCVSPFDKDYVLAAGYDHWYSTDGGTTWNDGGWSWDLHVDNHAMEFDSTGRLFSGNDGGISWSDDGGVNWANISAGLSITQYYRLGTSRTNPNLIMLGAQDNNFYTYNSGSWSNDGYSDGMECAIDWSDPSRRMRSAQYGWIEMTTDGGSSWTGTFSGMSGSWITPYQQDPFNASTWYYAGEDGSSTRGLYKSTDYGATYSLISGSSIWFNADWMAVAPSNSNYIYVGEFYNAMATTNGGTTWYDMTSGLPIASNAMTYLCVDELDPDHIWVTLSGYNAGQKVYESTDAGLSWINVSAGLPNVPAVCIIHNKMSSTDEVYVGTDLGVYYMDNTMGSWQPFNTNLPPVVVDELEIDYTNGKIRAATYGRGLWESPLNTVVALDAPLSQQNLKLFPNPARNTCQIMPVTGTNITALHLVNALGQELQPSWKWNGTAAEINLYGIAPGVYFVHATSSGNTQVLKLVVQ